MWTDAFGGVFAEHISCEESLVLPYRGRSGIRMGANPHKKKFFFINKTENSDHLSRSLHHESVAIQRYVQTGRKRARIPQHLKVPTVVHVSGSTLDLDQHESVLTNHETENIESVHSEHEPHTQPNGLQFVRDEFLHGTPTHGASLILQRTLSERDPFGVSCVPIDKSVAGLLHYYMYCYHPSQWPNEMALLRHGVYVFEDAVMQVMRAAISDKMTMHCLLGAAACRLQYVDKLPSSLVAGAERRHIIIALQRLSSYVAVADLQDPEQLRRCLTCIMFLSSAEAYRGELGASKMHLDAAVRLLKPIGGISALRDQPLHGQYAMADLFLACVDLRPCFFECSYDPGPASSLQLDDTEWGAPHTSTEACSLLDRSKSFIPIEMQAIIQDLVESHTVRTRITTSTMPPSRAKQVTHWITLRNMAIRHRLLALETSDCRCHALRTAIIMWTLLTMNITGRAKTVKLMAPKLKDILSSTLETHWVGNEDIKLWIALIGLYCADDDSEASDWFRGECCKLTPCCIPTSVANICTFDLADRLEVFQHNFFYDSETQNARTRSLADSLEHK